MRGHEEPWGGHLVERTPRKALHCPSRCQPCGQGTGLGSSGQVCTLDIPFLEDCGSWALSGLLFTSIMEREETKPPRRGHGEFERPDLNRKIPAPFLHFGWQAPSYRKFEGCSLKNIFVPVYNLHRILQAFFFYHDPQFKKCFQPSYTYLNIYN